MRQAILNPLLSTTSVSFRILLKLLMVAAMLFLMNEVSLFFFSSLAAALDSAQSSLSCSPDQFACHNGSECIPKSKMCTGKSGCADFSHTIPSECNNCADDHLFLCKEKGSSLCLSVDYQCITAIANSCDNADEFVSECGATSPPCSSDQFACHDGTKCIPNEWVCLGFRNCEDYSHTTAAQCNNCTDDHLVKCQTKGKDICISKGSTCDGTRYCSSDQFACHDGAQCIPNYKLCDGFPWDGCADYSHSNPAQCNDCAGKPGIGGHFFKCQLNGKEVCTADLVKCDGIAQCSDMTDELLTECGPECSGARFECRKGGRQVCLEKDFYFCDGEPQCDDGTDEDPSACDLCKKPGLFTCRDGSQCIKSEWRCDGRPNCADGSDEADSECGVCAQEGAVRCPGFPDNCGVLCDGRPTCPDNWDELLSTCEAYNLPCTKEANLYPCTDLSRCLGYEQMCDGYKNCHNGEDETAQNCKAKCHYHRAQGNHLHQCDGDSCVPRRLLCSSRNVPLCNDRSDMNASLCDPDQTGERKCFTDFFNFGVDPYRWMCEDGSKCILRTSLCNNNPDCQDESDEQQGCPWYVRLNLSLTLLICLGPVILSQLLCLLFKLWSRSLSKISDCGKVFTETHSYSSPALEETNISRSVSSERTGKSQLSLQESKFNSNLNSIHELPIYSLTSTTAPTPYFLLHPALSDLEGQHWLWQDVGKELSIEVVFFNRDNKFLESFLSKIESQDSHPDTVYKVFNGLFCYLEAEGHTRVAVAVAMGQSIGHHRLAHLALKGPPNALDRKAYQFKKWLRELENKNSASFALFSFAKLVASSVPAYLIFLDMNKDMILYKILSSTISRLAEGCEDLKSTCLAATPAEENLLTAMLVVFIISFVLTSLHAWYQRHHFFKTNRLFSFVLFVASPLLPAVYHLEIASISQTLEKEKKSISIQEYQAKKKDIEKLTDIVQQSKSIEVGLEAISQILILCGLATFYDFVFKAPSGQTYSYFYGVALLVLKGNAELFIVSILISFVGPAAFFLNNENHKRRSSFNITRKILLLLRNMLLILARLGTFVSAIFIPVIKDWEVFIGNKGVDAADQLENPWIDIEFNNYFNKGLQAVSDDIKRNYLCFLGFILLHMLVVTIHGIFCSAKLGTSTMRERLLHLVSSFWLPLPFLTIRGVDRGEEKAELWFLIVLHTTENISLLLVSKWANLPGYSLGLLLIQISLLTINIVALILSIVKKKKLVFLLAFSNVFVVFILGLLSETILLPMLAMDLSIVALNILGVAVAYFYTKNFELYANIQDLPNTLPDLPSYGPEVRPCLKDKKHFIDMFSHTMSILYRTYQLGQWRLVDTIITRKASERKVVGA